MDWNQFQTGKREFLRRKMTGFLYSPDPVNNAL
jgi:hypothetical protein